MNTAKTRRMPDTQMQDVKYLTARRAYEFRPDDLRLSTLATTPVGDQLQQVFRFRTTGMGTPSPSFGEVPNTFPPGYVFDLGFWLSPKGELVPIRFIHFEPQRIVIDVAGDSDAITAIYELLSEVVARFTTPDGSPIIGEPIAILDFSEITLRCSFAFEAVLPPPLRRLYARYLGVEQSATRTLLPVLSLTAYDADKVYAPVAEARTFNFAMRTGTRPDEHIYFSGAPLDTESHLAYLRELVQAVTEC